MSEAAILIRTRDEHQWIGRVLDAVLSQTISSDIVVLDSGSRDATVDEVRRRPAVRLLQMDAADFTYGRALNRGFASCDAPFLVALSGHALPRDERWLERLLAPFSDTTVAAVYGRHLPHDGLDPFRSREVLAYWGAEPREDVAGQARFSNANGAVRSSLWRLRPFDETLPSSEDREWAEWALQNRHRVLYRPEAAVFHSHAESPLRRYRRLRAEAMARDATAETPQEALRRFLWLTRDDLRGIAGHPRMWPWAPYSPALRAAEVLADRPPRRHRVRLV